MAKERKRALITGASSGLGREYAYALHAQGYDVILTARREDRLREICGSLNEKRSNSAEFISADLSALSASSALLQRARRGDIEILVNNAGFGVYGKFEGEDLARTRDLISVNVVSPLILTQSVVAGMKERGMGSILFVSSVGAVQPLPYLASYGASKAFEYNFGIALREELRPYGISVLVVCPGPTATEFGSVAGPVNFSGPVGSDTARLVVDNSLKRLKGGGVTFPTIRAKLFALLSALVPTALSSRILATVLSRRD